MHECDAVWDADGEAEEWKQGAGPSVLPGRAQDLHPMEALPQEREGKK